MYGRVLHLAVHINHVTEYFFYVLLCTALLDWTACINDLGGPEEIEKRKSSEALLQEKKFRRAFSTKKAFRRGKNWRGYREEKISSFSNFPPPPPEH